MDAEILREAAALMRERAEAARAGRWFAEGDEVRADWTLVRQVATCHGSIDVGNAANAEHIASWHPAVALAVADLLDLAAEHEKREGDECGQGYTASGYGYVDPSCSQCGTPDEYAEPWPCAYATRALNLARAYLGRTDV